MWKQILNKLPRKSQKPDQDSSRNPSLGANVSSQASSQANEANTALKRASAAAIFPSNVIAGIEPLLAFKDVSSSEKMNLFISKVSLCCVAFDFSDPAKSVQEKEIKRVTLLELVDFVSQNPPKFSEPAILASCKMCSINLFRAFPPNRRLSNKSSSENDDDDEPTFQPAWSHLQIVYDFLLKFVTSTSLEAKAGKKYINHSFILKIIELFDSEDPRERDCLKAVLHRIYGKFMAHRPFLRKGISNVFYRFVFETEKHNGIAELLEIFGSVITGFALPLKEEHKIFLCRALIPLHKPKSLGVYFQQLSYCVIQFIEKEPVLACSVVEGLLRYWPITNSQKEVMFLGELEEILELINMAEFQKIMVPLFWRIRHCINSYHFQVAERALFLWNNDGIINLIRHNRHIILPIIFPALESNAKNHWNHAVLNLTLNVKKMLVDMDDALVLSYSFNCQEAQDTSNLAIERRKEIWDRLENTASLQPMPMVGNTAVLGQMVDLLYNLICLLGFCCEMVVLGMYFARLLSNSLASVNIIVVKGESFSPLVTTDDVSKAQRFTKASLFLFLIKRMAITCLKPKL